MKIFTKKQLRLREDIGENKPELAVTNPDSKNDSTQGLDSAVSATNQKNSIGADLRIDTSQFSNVDMTDDQRDTETVMPNTSSSIAKIKTDINTGRASGSYILKNGVERDGKLVESITFTKKEMNEFLEQFKDGKETS